MKDRSGAALWEYLLVIVIVVVIGGVLLSAIKGSNGIGKIWNNLFNQFNNLTNTNVK